MLRKSKTCRSLVVEHLEDRQLLTGFVGQYSSGIDFASDKSSAGLDGMSSTLDRAWIAHGFNPLQNWDAFLQKYQPGPDGVYYNQMLTALEARTSDASGEVTPVIWNSNDGWMQAIGLTIVKGGVSAERWGPETTELLHSVLDTFIESGLTEARLESIQTSEVIEQQVLDFVEAKSETDQANTNIYLVGHSRGGEVVSRAVNSLRPKLSSMGVSSQLILLDAYGRDWPGISSTLGTESPFPTAASNDYNLLVDVGLDELLTIGRSVTESIVDDALGQIAGEIPLPAALVPDDIYSASLWRAPIRTGMENLFLPESNHISLPDEFFRDDIVIREPNSATEREMTFDDFLNPIAVASSSEEDLTTLSLFKEIRGGSAEQLLDDAARFEMLSQAISVPPPEAAAKLFSIFSSPDSWLRGLWTTAGDVILDPVSARIQLRGDGASLSQLVALPPGERTIRIEGSQINGTGQPGDSLRLFLANNLIGEIEGQALLSQDGVEFTIQNDRSRSLVGELELRYVTADLGSGFALSSVMLAEQVPHVEIFATNAYPEPRLEFSGSVDFELDADFYLESNAISGLQLGQKGDVELQLEMGASGWVATLPQLDSSPQQVLMTFELLDGTMVYSELPIRNRFQTNIVQPLDVSEDAFTTPLDALIVINYLNTAAESNRVLTPLDARVDANMDGFATPLDALLIINHLNQSSFAGEAEAPAPVSKSGLRIETIDWTWLLEKQWLVRPWKP